MPLTDLAVRNAKVTGKHYTLLDMQGLYLDITAKGGRAAAHVFWPLSRAFLAGGPAAARDWFPADESLVA